MSFVMDGLMKLHEKAPERDRGALFFWKDFGAKKGGGISDK